MTKPMYLFKDVKSGEYEFYGVFVNDAVAVRAFKHACKEPGVFGEDLELYRTASINTSTGKLCFEDSNVGFGIEEPEFICNGKDLINVQD